MALSANFSEPFIKIYAFLLGAGVKLLIMEVTYVDKLMFFAEHLYGYHT